MRYMHKITKIVLIFMLIGAFLCQDIVYALRPPMQCGDIIEKSKGSSKKKWGATKTAVYERFKTPSERKEALQYAELFVQELKENEMKYQPFLEEIIPELVNLSRDIGELTMFLSLGMKLAENGIYPRPTLKRGIPKLVRLTKNTDELKLFINLAMGLAVNGISPNPTLEQGLPVAYDLTEDINELRDMRDYLYILNLDLKRNSIYSWHVLNQVFSEAFREVNDIEEFKIVCRDILSKMTSSTASDARSLTPLSISSSSIRSAIDKEVKIQRIRSAIDAAGKSLKSNNNNL